MVFVHARMTGRLCKSMVEASFAGTCDVNQRAVEHHPSHLIDVHAFIQQVLNNPPGLRNTKDQRMIDFTRKRIGAAS